MIESIAESLHFASKQPNSTAVKGDDRIQGRNNASIHSKIGIVKKNFKCLPWAIAWPSVLHRFPTLALGSYLWPRRVHCTVLILVVISFCKP